MKQLILILIKFISLFINLIIEKWFSLIIWRFEYYQGEDVPDFVEDQGKGKPGALTLFHNLVLTILIEIRNKICLNQ